MRQPTQQRTWRPPHGPAGAVAEPSEAMARLLHPGTLVVLGDRRHAAWRRRAVRTLRAGTFGGVVLDVGDPRRIPRGADVVLAAVAASHLLDVVRACATAEVSVLVVVEPARVVGTLRRALVDQAHRGHVRVLGPGVRTLDSSSDATGWRLGPRPAALPDGAAGVVGRDTALDRALDELRAAGEGVSLVIDVGGGSDLGLTDAAVAALRDDGTALVAVAAPPGRGPRWDDLSRTADVTGKVVIAVGARPRPAPDRSVVRVPRRDLPAAVSVLDPGAGHGHGVGVVVVGDSESAGPLRRLLLARGVCTGRLTQQAEMRLQHLHLDTLVADGPPVQATPAALVTAAATASECPDVGVVVVVLRRPRGPSGRSRLLDAMAPLAREGTGCPVVAVVPGGIAGAPVPVFSDPPACVDVLRCAHVHAVAPSTAGGRWGP